MTSQTMTHRKGQTAGTEIDEGWLPVGHYDPSFVAGIREQIESLRQLAPNWDGYGAPVIAPTIIDAAECFISRLPENLAFRPWVVPTARGGIQLEWSEGQKSLELEFESSRVIRYLQWDPDAGIEVEDSFSVNEIDTAVDLIRWFMTGSCR